MRTICLFSLVTLIGCSGSKPVQDSGATQDSGGSADPDADRDGYRASEDCDDGDSSVRPNATEVCDGVDNDCDGLTDDADDSITGDASYTDADQDGYGDDATAVYCSTVDGAVPYGGDCDDSNATYNPGASETDCTDPNDYNCDGSVGATDADADGYAACEECNDADAASHPDADEICDGMDNDCDRLIDDADTGVVDATSYYTDNDADGYGDSDSVIVACDEQAGLTTDGGDCDDSDADYHPGADESNCSDPNDYNCDGSTAYDDADHDGYAACEDCDDANAAANPAGDEVCDDVDNDCDGDTDDEDVDVSGATTWYSDADGDTHGDASHATEACDAPEGSVASSDDCDDEDAAINPDAAETCDDIDNDCDDAVDDADPDIESGSTWYADNDGDGYGDADTAVTTCDVPAGYVTDGTDCDDNRSNVHPGGSEICDSLDNDCDGLTDGDDSSVTGASTWYADDDGDGYGDAATTKTSCSEPKNYTDDSTDCDDGDNDIYPGAKEICDDEDNDCDGYIDDADSDVADATTYYYDGDSDKYGDDDLTAVACDKPTGYASKGGDCDDADKDVNPGETDVCDAADEDCSGVIDDGGSCPCNQEWSGDHSYLFCEAEYTWTSAEYYCDYYGYELVTIDDATENSFVYTGATTYDYYDYWWIGFNDRDTEGTWKWDGGATSTYTNWASGQPNGGGSEDCAMMYPYYGSTWYDYYCTYSTQNFVCESP